MKQTCNAELWAEFESGEAALSAVRSLREQGFASLQAFTPYPLPELEEALGLPRPRLIPFLALVAASAGAGGSFVLMWWTAARDYPLNVGGRPLNSFVTDIPIMFESAVLCAALAIFFATLFCSGMPRLNHPLDRIAGFERTSIDRFWIGASLDRQDTGEALSRALTRLGAPRVHWHTGSGAE